MVNPVSWFTELVSTMKKIHQPTTSHNLTRLATLTLSVVALCALIIVKGMVDYSVKILFIVASY